MKTRLAVAAALLALTGTVFGAHWKPVSITPERTISIDMDALVRDGNTVQAWDWQKFGTGQTSATWQGTFFWVKSLTHYHCVQRTTDAILKVYFGNDGVEIKRVHLEGLQFPAAVEPDSLREKILEMACNPPKPAIKPVATATKPAPETRSAESKSPEPDASASNGNPAKTDSNPAKAGNKAGATAKAAPADAVVPNAKPSAAAVKRFERPPYSRTARMTATKKATGGLKLAGLKLAKARLQPNLKCPPPGPASASEPAWPAPPTPQFTDAGNDGMFN